MQTKAETSETHQPKKTFFDDDDYDDYNDYLTNSHVHAGVRGPQFRGWSSVDGVDPANLSSKETGTERDSLLIFEIEKKLEEHARVMLHSMDCLGARVTQIESRVNKLDHAFDDLKEYIQFSNGKTDRKLLELGSILTEVHSGIRDWRDKQEIAETQLELTKLQLLKEKSQSKRENSASQVNIEKNAPSSVSGGPSVPSQLPVTYPQHPVTPNPANMSQQNFAPANTATAGQQLSALASSVQQLAPQLPQIIPPPALQQEPHYHLPSVTQIASHQQLQACQTEQSQPSSYWPAHLLQNAQSMQQPFVHQNYRFIDALANPHLQHIPVGTSNVPSHSIQTTAQPPRTMLSVQQNNVDFPYYSLGKILSRKERESTNPTSSALGVETGWQPRSTYPPRYDLYHAQSEAKLTKPLQPSPTLPAAQRESTYSQLPIARILPRAIPTASIVDGGSSSASGEDDGVPVDDVVNKVVSMGFRRDVVRATVKQLKENGKSADLNVVLDKLMNE